MPEHLFDLEDLQTALFVEDPCHQVLQQVPHLQGHPVLRLLFHRCNIQFVIINVAGRPERGYTHDARHVAAADSLAAVSKPFLPGQGFRFHGNQGRVPYPLFCIFRHLSCPPSRPAREIGGSADYLGTAVLPAYLPVVHLVIRVFGMPVQPAPPVSFLSHSLCLPFLKMVYPQSRIRRLGRLTAFAVTAFANWTCQHVRLAHCTRKKSGNVFETIIWRP